LESDDKKTTSENDERKRTHNTYILLTTATMNSAPVQAMLLGQPSDDVRKEKGLIYSGGLSVRYFINSDEFVKFAADVENVKNTIASINSMHGEGTLSNVDYRDRVEHDWLDGCVASFLQEYGLNSVPIDIRNAIDDVCNGLELPITTPWPRFQYESVTPNVDVLSVRFNM